MAPNNCNEKTKPHNPNEHLAIPKWINADYFRPIIEKDVLDFESIINFTPIAATQPGENYTSIMVRVLIDVRLKDGSEQEISYILKTMLEASEGANLISDAGLFPKEQQMYEVNMKNFIKLYEEAGETIQLTPKCLHVEKTPERITLIMEDLKRQHFVNVDRLKGLDINHMRGVLIKLAELHAASARNFELNGPYDSIYSKTFFTEENCEMFEKMSLQHQKPLFKAMNEWDLPNSKKYMKIFKDPKPLFRQALTLNNVDDNEFNVLNHGDLWANNIMFNYKNNGEIDKILFVDLQMAKWGSPAQDLWYFITTSASLDIKIKEFDYFIRIYHERLVECLKMLNYSKPIPTLRDIHSMMCKYGFWGFLTSTGVLVAVLLPSDKDSSMNMMMASGLEAEQFHYKTYSNPYYVKAIRQLFPFFENRGCMEIN